MSGWPTSWWSKNPQAASITPGHAGGRRRPVETLTPRQRRRLFVCGADGLEPATLWLNHMGLPMTAAAWQSMFSAANDRCRRREIALSAHPHMLRHTYAVVTLEQLQREHIRELGAMNRPSAQPMNRYSAIHWTGFAGGWGTGPWKQHSNT